MIEPRKQGRPPRGGSEVGRTRLLEQTRAALKCKPRIDLQRREVALIAGVTPALVSYYYPDKWDLFAAAARPVIESYTTELVAILRSIAVPRIKILSITYLFLEFNLQNGYLLDFYLENSERMARTEDLKALRAVYAKLQAFFDTLLRESLIKGKDPAFIQTSLWALCRHVAQQSQFSALANSTDRARVLRLQTEEICDLFLNGIGTQRLHCGDGPGEKEHRVHSAA